jgi:hypothetical protein
MRKHEMRRRTSDDKFKEGLSVICGEVGRWMVLAQDLAQWRALAIAVLNIWVILPYSKSRDSSVGIALGYGLDDWGSRV